MALIKRHFRGWAAIETSVLACYIGSIIKTTRGC